MDKRKLSPSEEEWLNLCVGLFIICTILTIFAKIWQWFVF